MLVFGLAVAGERAHAQGAPAAATTSDAGRDAAHDQIALGLSKYEAGEYRKAAELFIEAYAVVPDANLLYNAARCYEHLGENRKAIVRYQQFIEAPDVDEGGKVRANAALQRLEQAEFLALRKGPSDHSEAQPAVESSRGPQHGAVASGAPWYLLGLGTVAIGGGAWSLVNGLEQRREITSDPAFEDPSKVHALTQSEAETRLASSQLRVTWGIVGMGAGGVLVASAVVWWVLEGVDESEAGPARLDVQATSNEARVLVGGQF